MCKRTSYTYSCDHTIDALTRCGDRKPWSTLIPKRCLSQLRLPVLESLATQCHNCKLALAETARNLRRETARQQEEAKLEKQRLKREKEERYAIIEAKIMEGREPTIHTGKQAQLKLEDEYADVDGILEGKMRLENLKDMWKVLRLVEWTRLSYVD